MTVILALGAVLAIIYMRSRPEYKPGTYVTDVGDTKVLVRSNPKRQVEIISTPSEQPVLAGGEGQGGEGQGGGAEEPTPVEVPTLPPQDPTPVEVPTLVPTATPQLCVRFVDHTVQPGQTLYSISNQYNTTIALMARFGIDATDIVPGNLLSIPVANEACCPGNQAYVVREGDTLSSIAIKCQTTVANLKQINGFGDIFRLDETSVICVPPQPQG